MYRQIRSEYSGRLAIVVLDRPERRNAFSAELMREMIACARELESRNDVDAVIVSGAGGWFSAAFATLRVPRAKPRSSAVASKSGYSLVRHSGRRPRPRYRTSTPRPGAQTSSLPQ